MKLAEVEYTGRVRHQTHRAVSGESYVFTGEPVAVSSLADARQFESKPNFEVEYTALGQLADVANDEAGDVQESLEELGYSAKQKIAGHFDDIKGNASEDELEAALEEKAARLQEQMDSGP